MTSWKEWELYNKKVLVRLDLNCPLSQGKVADDFRIQKSLPTIRALLEKGAKPILMSHLGRPKGKVVAELSLSPIRERLEELLKVPVHLAKDIVGESAKELAQKLSQGEVLLLENLRFEAGEEKDDPEFAKALASLGDFYINDAFGCSHRAHASVHAITQFLPSAFGPLMEEELSAFSKIQQPERPFLLLLGGAKLETKLPVIRFLLDKVDKILLGGAMAYTFLKARGKEVGDSLVEEEFLPECKELMGSAGSKILLPLDHVTATSLEDPSVQIHQSIPKGQKGFDIGLSTLRRYAKEVEEANTIVWNGPFGVFENSAFSLGTHYLAWQVAMSEGVTIAGGGDIVAALRQFGLLDKLSFVSTGGGAFLELLSGRELPGIVAIQKKE